MTVFGNLICTGEDFWDFIFSIFLFLSKTLEHIGRHVEVRQNCSAMRHIFNSLSLSLLVFDVLFSAKMRVDNQ